MGRGTRTWHKTPVEGADVGLDRTTGHADQPLQFTYTCDGGQGQRGRLQNACWPSRGRPSTGINLMPGGLRYLPLCQSGMVVGQTPSLPRLEHLHSNALAPAPLAGAPIVLRFAPILEREDQRSKAG